MAEYRGIICIRCTSEYPALALVEILTSPVIMDNAGGIYVRY